MISEERLRELWRDNVGPPYEGVVSAHRMDNDMVILARAVEAEVRTDALNEIERLKKIITALIAREKVIEAYARNEAYEAAAKVCDGMTGRRPWECAAAIRALKGA